MEEVCKAYPSVQRVLYRFYHPGSYHNRAFRPAETLHDLCRRNKYLDVEEVLAHIQSSPHDDGRTIISAKELSKLLQRREEIKLLDIRSREEFEFARIKGSILMTQQTVPDLLAHWPPEKCLVIIDHQGRQCLDAAAYFVGHGLNKVLCLRGGIDAWSQEVDPKVPRYRLT